MGRAPLTLADRVGLPPCTLHGERACALCYTRAPTEAEIAEAVAIHAYAEQLGAAPIGQAHATALWWRLHRPRLITLRGLVVELAVSLVDALLGELAGARCPLDFAAARLLARRLSDVASRFDRRLREPRVEVPHG